MTGGLAAALLPVVEKSGAIWVGSSGRVRDGSQKEPFVEIEALGAGALALLRFQKPETVFWIQDYHFLALGAELRDLGVTQPVGFFLHTPWPPRAVISGMPHHRELIEAMLAYDLIGFQTSDDCENFISYVQSDLGLVVRNGAVTSRHGTTRVAAFPIGIDPEKFAHLAAKAVSHPDVSRLRRSLHGEKLAIGVDRLDYSKGLINRINAFDRMWTCLLY